MKAKATARRRTFAGKQNRNKHVRSYATLEDKWARAAAEEPPIAGASLALLEERLAAI